MIYSAYGWYRGDYVRSKVRAFEGVITHFERPDKARDEYPTETVAVILVESGEYSPLYGQEYKQTIAPIHHLELIDA